MLSTRFTGFNLPLITIAWTRNGEMISSATDRVSIVTMGIGGPNGTSILTVSPVNTPSDGGIYIVTATNPAGSDMTVFTVNITGEYLVDSTSSYPFITRVYVYSISVVEL